MRVVPTVYDLSTGKINAKPYRQSNRMSVVKVTTHLSWVDLRLAGVRCVRSLHWCRARWPEALRLRLRPPEFRRHQPVQREE